jgi:hypothetical protein
VLALTRVVKLSSLADAQSTTANDQNFFHIHQVSCSCNSTAVEVCLCIRSFLALRLELRNRRKCSDLFLNRLRPMWESVCGGGERPGRSWQSYQRPVRRMLEEESRRAARQTSTTGSHWSGWRGEGCDEGRIEPFRLAREESDSSVGVGVAQTAIFLEVTPSSGDLLGGELRPSPS